MAPLNISFVDELIKLKGVSFIIICRPMHFVRYGKAVLICDIALCSVVVILKWRFGVDLRGN